MKIFEDLTEMNSQYCNWRSHMASRFHIYPHLQISADNYRYM